jgi:HD-GYP domain-containing protein (c-di-GMP phosphodiesterase class II)
MTIRKIDIDRLQLGMYVVMPTSWDSHPFLRNKFLVTSQNQIDKIIEAGFTEITIDTEKGLSPVAPPAEREKKPEKQNEEGEASIRTDKLGDAIKDRTLPALEKSRVVRDTTMTMMESLMDKPTAKNIRAVKTAITEIVKMMLTDDETASYLTKITSHDFYTYTHSVNVGFLGVSMAKILFRDSKQHNLHELGVGFFLHDIGKVQIDPAIINKPGRLTDDEMNIIRKHPSMGFKILSDAHQMTEECKTIVLHHHERYDGTGYPKKLRGEEIHFYGKICAIADVYDALTSNRPYREPLDPFDALILMKKEMINHFQRDLYEKFVLMLS